MPLARDAHTYIHGWPHSYLLDEIGFFTRQHSGWRIQLRTAARRQCHGEKSEFNKISREEYNHYTGTGRKFFSSPQPLYEVWQQWKRLSRPTMRPVKHSA
ncbi:hypothetical protein AFLA_000791 [Aspergillus flavus NRRL3357]|nr:hypothetical protein AFLA_000791 [Aspergillus flavus NRRL3357]